jgi:hypothetical protein
MISRLAIPPRADDPPLGADLDLRDHALAGTAEPKPTFAFSRLELAVGGCRRFLAVMFLSRLGGDRYRAKEEI